MKKTCSSHSSRPKPNLLAKPVSPPYSGLLFHPVAQARKHGNPPTLLLIQATNSITTIYRFYLLNFLLLHSLLSKSPRLWSKMSLLPALLPTVPIGLPTSTLGPFQSANLTLKANPITTSFNFKPFEDSLLHSHLQHQAPLVSGPLNRLVSWPPMLLTAHPLLALS